MKYKSAQHGFSHILILFFVVIVILGIATVFLFTHNPSSTSTLSPGVSPSGTTGDTSTANPLINSRDVDQVQQNYDNQLEKKGLPTPVQPKFDYQLAPELQKKQSLLSVQSALAATTCGIDSAPSSVPVFTLKAHWTPKEAGDTAKEFSISASPASVPTDGGGFAYFFSEPLTNGFLSLFEASGMYTYHAVLQVASTDRGLNQAELTSDDERKKHGIFEGFMKLSGSFDPTVGSYVFLYRKDQGLFPMVDTGSIKALGSDSVCGVLPSSSVNTATVVVSIDDKLSRIIKNTRVITTTKTLPRESFTDAFDEYHTKPPVDPIVVGDDITGGTVTIDEVTLVWYDYGQNFAQTAYMPMYLTSGTVTSGTNHARVFTLIPAISMKELVKSGVVPSDESSLKLGTFNPKPPKPNIAGCPGNTVDYTVSCSVNGQTVCSAFMGINPDSDPNNICEDGCKSTDGTISVQQNQDPCRMFLEQNHIPTDKYNQTGNRAIPSGTYSCVLNGCPC